MSRPPTLEQLSRYATEVEEAIADKGPDQGYDEDTPRCGSWGPGGECCRDLGHTDRDVWNHNKHISFDTDHYMDWPVGWRKTRDTCPHCAGDIAEHISKYG